MARGSVNRSNRILVQGAEKALDQFKYEVANELGIQPDQGYWGNLTSRECGAVGGQMVRKMIEQAESQLVGKMGGMQ
ncbi:MAG TPA: alpha/beta-type small acid-soluble spore protein [Clostridiales bacterium]|nr:alpha/beta-type small acid-soluble spore protein [Clostridiales bacterium]